MGFDIKTSPTMQGKSGSGRSGGANASGFGVNSNGKGNALKPNTTKTAGGAKKPPMFNANSGKK